MEGEAMSEWQPIETAPKDGTEVFLWTEEKPNIVVAYWDTYEGSGWWRFSESVLSDIAGEVENATHWMPLPEPPKP